MIRAPLRSVILARRRICLDAAEPMEVARIPWGGGGDFFLDRSPPVSPEGPGAMPTPR